MDDFAVNDCQGRPNFLQHLVRHGEVVIAQDGEVCKLSRFDRSDLIFLSHEPAVVRRQLQDFMPRDLLVSIDENLPGIQPRCRVIGV